jgi:hypothetical protein
VGIGQKGQHTILCAGSSRRTKKGEERQRREGGVGEQQFVTVPSLIIIRPSCSTLFCMPVHTRQSKAIILQYVNKFSVLTKHN